MKEQQTAAVIGAGEDILVAALKDWGTDEEKPGSSGLSMLKTLRDDGFKATLYERRGQVGGLWAYSDDPLMTTALPSEYTATFGQCSSG